MVYIRKDLNSPQQSKGSERINEKQKKSKALAGPSEGEQCPGMTGGDMTLLVNRTEGRKGKTSSSKKAGSTRNGEGKWTTRYTKGRAPLKEGLPRARKWLPV